MRRVLMVLGLGGLMTAGVALAEQPGSKLEGRWQGVIAIPGLQVDVTLDIRRNAAQEWIGSTSLAQLKVRGAMLAAIKVEGANLSADLANDLGGPGDSKASYVAHLDADGALHGEFHQAGHSVPFVLKPAGEAQVEMPRPRGTVPKAMEGKWTGDYIGPGDYARHVTLTLGNPGRDGSQAQFVVVGKKTFDVPVSWLGYSEGFLELESSPTGVGYEGRLRAGQRRIEGAIEVADSEYVLNLEHAP